MDEIWKQIVAQLPFVAMVGFALWIVYRDGRNDRKYMMDLLEKMYLSNLEARGESVADHAETLAKRP
jgi:hypothetical protein